MQKDLCTTKKIGIWGYGVVGKSVHRFLAHHFSHLYFLICDTQDSVALDANTNHDKVTYYNQSHIESFFKEADSIFVSPGIDTRVYEQYGVAHKYRCELDLFYAFFSKPIIAVTGSVGKTTTTMLIDALLKTVGMRSVAAGNIGVGVCDIIDQEDELDYAVVEVSSFQLAMAKTFKPTVAVVTNLYPNHLDRHGTFHEYVAAKMSMVMRQHTGDHAIMHASCKEIIGEMAAKSVMWYGAGDYGCEMLTINGDGFFVFQGRPLGHTALFDPSLMQENCMAAVGVLYALNIPLPTSRLSFLGAPHRMQLVAVIDGVTFINDSKSTTIQSTLHAVKTCSSKPILFIGGLSKGVDRRRLIGQLVGLVSSVICFGAEVAILYSFCLDYGIPAYQSSTLEGAFEIALSLLKSSNEIILLSPSGSSYDQYKDFQERGNHFIELVSAYQHRINVSSMMSVHTVIEMDNGEK